jgi:hypothetical protein
VPNQRVVFQVINFNREEIFYGTTDIMLDKEIERIAKDPKGPAAHWKKGDIIQWRPLTDLLEPISAANLHRELEKKTPPNNYKVLQTFKT